MIRSNLDKRKIRLLNVSFVNTTKDELLNECDSGTIYPLNIDTLVTLQKDKGYYEACTNAEYLTVDSQIIYFLLKIFGSGIKEKIAGSDFFPAFCHYHKNNNDIKIFVLGGFGSVATKVQFILNTDANRQIVVDAFSPSYGFETNQSECDNIIERINASGATVLAVGVGAPKQEKWIFRYKNRLTNVRIFMAVGATLDFIAGDQRRAPKWMQNNGLEWLFRLILQPRRLARRYLVRDLQFIYYYLLEKLNIYTNPFD
jgi:exopolysaccharide biosynthesis WecB/TagA/CpsF family protein